MNKTLFTQWHEEGLLAETSLQKVKEAEAHKLFSLHWEIKTLLYLAVLLLSGGLGILVYKSIDSIGHTAILIFLALVCAGSFFYCVKHNAPFSVNKTASPNILFDYLLLLACLSFIPMVVLFLSAYYFDNIAILSLGITNLAAWLGISVTPLEILKANDFNNTTIILTGVSLSTLLIATALLTTHKKFKRHFEFTYINFGIHILFISCIAAMFHFDELYLLWFLLLTGIAYYFYRKALSDRSFYILLITTLYAYVGLCYTVCIKSPCSFPLHV